jgi:hypothetical protein
MKTENEIHIRHNKYSYLLISFHTGISTLADIAVQYYLKDNLKLQPGSYSRTQSITFIPWMLKPLFGLLSDMCPILGYRRKTYLLLCGLLDIVSWLIMAYCVNNIWTATLALFFVNTALAFSSVIGEAIVVELSQVDLNSTNSSNTAKDNISSYFILKNIGVLGSSYLKGYLVDIISLRSVFLIASMTPLLLILAGFMMYEDEITVKKDEEMKKMNTPEAENPTLFKEQPIDRMLHKEFLNFILQKQIFLPLLFIVLLMSTPAYDDPLFYFLTEELHFNGNILGLMSFASAITAIIAIWTYKRFFKHVAFKKVCMTGNLLYALFGFSASLLVSRLNTKIGISDYALAIFSSSACNMLGEFISMPILSLAAILCPKDLEATVYSVFMSAMNFGSIISWVMSSILTDVLGITTRDFTNLGKLILISNITCLIPLVMLFFIDNKYFQTATKVTEEPVKIQQHSNEEVN